MPATRHVRRRDGRGTYNPLALPSLRSLPSLPSFPSFFASPTSGSASNSSSRTNTWSSASTATAVNSEKAVDSEKDLDTATITDHDDVDLVKEFFKDKDTDTNERGYSTDTHPFFLRRSARSRRVDDLVQRGLDSSQLLGNISSSMDLETVQLVANSCALLFGTVQTVRTNRTQTRMLLERVHQIVRALINLCGDAQAQRADGTAGVGLAPEMARAIDSFSKTLTDLHEILQVQASTGLLARILRHIEIRDQLQQCDEELQQALTVFSVKTGLLTHAALGGVRRADADRHAEILRALRAKGMGLAVGTAGEGI